jgi:hypothetical protein
MAIVFSGSLFLMRTPFVSYLQDIASARSQPTYRKASLDNSYTLPHSHRGRESHKIHHYENDSDFPGRSRTNTESTFADEVWTPPRAHSTWISSKWKPPGFGIMQNTVRSIDLDHVLSRLETDSAHWAGMHNATSPRSPFASR